MTRNKQTALMPVERISQSILILRGQRVLLDANLAVLYGVPTGALIQAVKRNLKRFPEDFMFQLTADEQAALRSQFVISNEGRGGRRYAPYAFTEQGVASAARIVVSPIQNYAARIIGQYAHVEHVPLTSTASTDLKLVAINIAVLRACSIWTESISAALCPSNRYLT